MEQTQGAGVHVLWRWQDWEDRYRGRYAVVIDVLRATTTLITVLARGAEAVLPVAGLEEARALARSRPGWLLGGERDNVAPPGFDGGNSPADYPPERVAGRRLVFTTTNGTRALDRVRTGGAATVALGALVNAGAVARAARASGRPAVLVCAGTEGVLSLEDVLAAGAMARYWPPEARSDEAQLAAWAYERMQADLPRALNLARHAASLRARGLEADIGWAAREDLFDLVPVVGTQGWITAGP
ncbi:MAG: 2-phosphosulfolactate phosphatase [Firmicutes bacterium]|nr:2-phosphosulfolactate phosphatase [Bacillota bacterium]